MSEADRAGYLERLETTLAELQTLVHRGVKRGRKFVPLAGTALANVYAEIRLVQVAIGRARGVADAPPPPPPTPPTHPKPATLKRYVLGLSMRPPALRAEVDPKDETN